MRRCWIILAAAAVAAGSFVAVAGAGPNAAARGEGPGRGFNVGFGYFAVSCAFSHRNDDDPIVFPGEPGRSHNHTFFGNRATNASSTPATLRGGATTCGLRADASAYWVPTLLVNGQPVEPVRATVYYVRRTREPVRAFPAGFQAIAGDSKATAPQSLLVTSWSCGGRFVSSTVPTCGRAGLRLQVNFGNCWDGSSLDSADHKSHLAYSADGRCPADHPVAVPAISLIVLYPVAGGAQASLSSGGQLSGHADFVNAWDQQKLERLVNRYLNRSRR